MNVFYFVVDHVFRHFHIYDIHYIHIQQEDTEEDRKMVHCKDYIHLHVVGVALPFAAGEEACKNYKNMMDENPRTNFVDQAGLVDALDDKDCVEKVDAADVDDRLDVAVVVADVDDVVVVADVVDVVVGDVVADDVDDDVADVDDDDVVVDDFVACDHVLNFYHPDHVDYGEGHLVYPFSSFFWIDYLFSPILGDGNHRLPHTCGLYEVVFFLFSWLQHLHVVGDHVYFVAVCCAYNVFFFLCEAFLLLGLSSFGLVLLVVFLLLHP